jgi:outer membrane lipoprotein-sorting protein
LSYKPNDNPFDKTIAEWKRLVLIVKILLLFLLSCNDSYATDVLVDITARLVKTPITQGEFQQEKRLKILRKPLLSTGVFTYSQTKGVIWQTLTPIPSLLLVNEARLMTGQGEQSIPPAFGKVFKAMLGGDLEQLSEGFIITGENKKTEWQCHLTPKDELLKKIISSIALSGDTELRSLEMQEVNGNSTRINFTKMTHPAQLTSEQQADFERLSP